MCHFEHEIAHQIIFAAGLCPILTDPENGMVFCSLGDDGLTTDGDTCVYQCDVGYELSHNPVRECQSDGTWTGSEPTCDLGENYV